MAVRGVHVHPVFHFRGEAVTRDWLAWLLIVLAMPAGLAGWRLKRRFGVLGFHARWWLVVPVVLLGLVASFWLSERWCGWVLRAGWAGLGSHALCRLLGDSRDQLQQLCTARVLMATYVLAAGMLAASLPVMHAAERRLMASDPAFDFSPRFGGQSRFAFESLETYKAGLLEAFDGKIQVR